jgi:glycine/D-amino acid oxidase-like deaminating enzyme
LQTAVSLLEAGYDVTVIAKHFPGDKSIEYTSPWAGAQWRTHASFGDVEQCAWDIASYKKWYEIVEQERKEPGSQKSGLGVNITSNIPFNGC